MRKILLSLGLLSVMTLCSGGVFAAAEDNKPKKGKFAEKFKDRAGTIDTDKLFEKLDSDSDGKLSKEEFKKFFENLGQDKLAAASGRLFARLDADSDGSLSKEEFKKFGLNLGGSDKGDFKEKLKAFKGKLAKWGGKKGK
jgi:hypothetical protein